MLNVNKMTATSDLLALNIEDCKMLETPSDQNLFMDLNEKDSETISGGYEVFQIKNNTGYDITHVLDNKKSFLLQPGETWTYTTYAEGNNIRFDEDGRADYTQYKSYDLNNGGVYAFEYNNYTPGNPYDIDIYGA